MVEGNIDARCISTVRGPSEVLGGVGAIYSWYVRTYIAICLGMARRKKVQNGINFKCLPGVGNQRHRN